MTNDSRERMLQSAATLFSSRGLNATSFSDVIDASGAPRGSIYHHFPGGKEELAEDAMRWTSERVLAFLNASDETTPTGVLKRFIGMWRRVVVASSGGAGCAIAGVAVDIDENARLMETARTIFRGWVDALADRLVASGLPRIRAASIALTALAGMEGALVMCRAEASVAPLDVVAAELLRLVSSGTEPGVT